MLMIRYYSREFVRFDDRATRFERSFVGSVPIGVPANRIFRIQTLNPWNSLNGFKKALRIDRIRRVTYSRQFCFPKVADRLYKDRSSAL